MEFDPTNRMGIANKKLMLAGLFLSKFNRDGLAALGFSSLQEAYNSFAYLVGGKPSSVKLYMQEFDPFFPNSRQGWRKRAIRPTRQAFIDEFGQLGLAEFVELIRAQFAGSGDVDLAVGKAAADAGIREDENSSFARRIMTGQAAENYFETNYRQVERFSDCDLLRTTSYGCGFDFKLSPPQGDFLAVEVKGLRNPTGAVQLTEKEYKMARHLLERFYLYVVVDFAHIPKSIIIENPLDSGIEFEKRLVQSEQSVWVAKIAS